ncbi:MAG: rRNA maturation RNase YbeY [Planctomycetota bacterium]
MTLWIDWRVDPPEGVDDALVARCVDAALTEGGRAGTPLSVVFVDDDTLARLHGETLGDPSPTDVMSFDLSDEFEPTHPPSPQGEVVVSVDRARDVASRRSVSPARETCLYVVHGVLHLCGHDDHDDADRARMRRAEAVVMRSLGFDDDPSPHDAD